MITHTSDRDEVTVISVYDLQSMVVCPEEESVLMTSFVSDLSALTLKQCNFYSIIFTFIIIKISKCPVFISLCLCLFKISFFLSAVECGDELDFKALRLDWLRLQVHLTHLNPSFC